MMCYKNRYEKLAFDAFPYNGDCRGVGDTHEKERKAFIEGMKTAERFVRDEVKKKMGQAERNGRVSNENELYYVGRFDLCGELLSIIIKED